MGGAGVIISGGIAAVIIFAGFVIIGWSDMEVLVNASIFVHTILGGSDIIGTAGLAVDLVVPAVLRRAHPIASRMSVPSHIAAFHAMPHPMTHLAFAGLMIGLHARSAHAIVAVAVNIHEGNPSGMVEHEVLPVGSDPSGDLAGYIVSVSVQQSAVAGEGRPFNGAG